MEKSNFRRTVPNTNRNKPNRNNPNWLLRNIDASKLEFEIRMCDLKPESEVDCSKLTDFKVVGSYNWCADSTYDKPVIIIPGRPSILKENLQAGQQLNKIKWKHTADENKSYLPRYPIEPIYRSVLECTPDFDFDKIDIIVDRGVMRTLNCVIEGGNVRERIGPNGCRIDFQRIGNSVVLYRYERNDFYTDYRRDFEAKMIKVKQGEFTRVVTYKLGDLNILQHNQVDCVENNSEDDDLDGLVSSLSHVDINNNLAVQGFEGSKLHYVRDGIFEKNQNEVVLGTKSTPKNQFVYLKWNMLFFSKSDSLVIGWHNKGFLGNIEKLNFDEVTKRCERSKESVQCSMSKLRDILDTLKSFAMKKQEDGTRYSAIFTEARNSFKIYKYDRYMDCLPKSFGKLFK